jgi:S1-C subfamily serine protease
VVTLDGKPIASYTADGLDQMFDEGKPGDKHAIEIQREGKKKKVTLKLKELL